MKKNSTYFDKKFSNYWDELINWKLRFSKTTNKLSSILNKHNCKNVLDVAAGTGFDSISLSIKKFIVTSQDISKEMLEKLNLNALNNNVNIKTICAPWDKYNSKINFFDAIICLGNSFVCELNKKKRTLAIINWYRLLKKKGIIIIDHRNYEKIKKSKKNLKSYNYSGKAKITCKKLNDYYSFKYKFSEGIELNLKMYPVLMSELINKFKENKFTYLYTLYDYNLRKNKNCKFYQHIFVK